MGGWGAIAAESNSFLQSQWNARMRFAFGIERFSTKELYFTIYAKSIKHNFESNKHKMSAFLDYLCPLEIYCLSLFYTLANKQIATRCQNPLLSTKLIYLMFIVDVCSLLCDELFWNAVIRVHKSLHFSIDCCVLEWDYWQFNPSRRRIWFIIRVYYSLWCACIFWWLFSNFVLFWSGHGAK